MASEIPFEKLKGDDRFWKIESAARTLKEFAKLKRKENSALRKAARQYLKEEVEDSKKTLAETS